MPKKTTARRPQARPEHRCASQGSGLIVPGIPVRQSARPKAALDNHSHRTHERHEQHTEASLPDGDGLSRNEVNERGNSFSGQECPERQSPFSFRLVVRGDFPIDDVCKACCSCVL